MLPLLGTVLVAALLGSVHCAAMCGPFACFAATRDGRPRLAAHWSYQLGRAVGYVTLGAVAGAAGVALDRAGAMAGIGRVAALVMATMLVGWGLHAVLRARGGRLGELRLPEAATRTVGRALAALERRPVALRGAATGLATGLLPCGWLWVFLALAAGTARPLEGMAVMAVFWFGSLPALAAVVAGAERLSGRWATRLPQASAIIIVLVGLASLAAHLQLIPAAHWLHRVLPTLPGATGAHGG